MRNAVLDVHTELCERLCVAFGHEDGVVAEAFGALLLGRDSSAYNAFEECVVGYVVLAGKADAKKALEATIEAITNALVDGDKIQLIGFGTFRVSERQAREGINPATKEKITIAAKKVAKFKAGAELADAIK